MYFEHFFEPGLAQKSYLVGCQKTGEAIVIDPRRDVDVYLTAARDNDLRITKIAETHIHADFLSGSRELAAATGAEILASDEGGPDWQYRFAHTGLRDGDQIHVGNVRLDVMHTPGHTPEHISFVLYDLPAGPAAMMAFTGDFVFVGDVGRPDLLEEAAGIKDTKIRGARDLWKSLRRFRELPHHVMVWPAHGAGSACGKALGAVPSSTVGYELATNWAFQVEDEETFVHQLLDGQPEPPYYFAEMKVRNRAGAPVLGTVERPPVIGPRRIAELCGIAEGHNAQSGEGLQSAQILDVRSQFAFAGAHIPGSISVPMDRSLSNWAGWTLDYDRPIVLIAPDHQVSDAVHSLIRIGLDTIVGYTPSVDGWIDEGWPVARVDQLTADELSAELDIDADKYHVIDVRSQSEFDEGHIDGAVNIHAGRLVRLADQIPRGRPLLVHCQSGYRSIIAVSSLERLGIGPVVNLIGGYGAYVDASPTAKATTNR